MKRSFGETVKTAEALLLTKKIKLFARIDQAAKSRIAAQGAQRLNIYEK
jgi:hypothetical protein